MLPGYRESILLKKTRGKSSPARKRCTRMFVGKRTSLVGMESTRWHLHCTCRTVVVLQRRAHTCGTSNRTRRTKAAGCGAETGTVLINSTGKALCEARGVGKCAFRAGLAPGRPWKRGRGNVTTRANSKLHSNAHLPIAKKYRRRTPDSYYSP